MNRINLFKWKHFEAHVILIEVRFYLQYSLSYREIVEPLMERGVQVSHTTIMRWVHQFGPELDKRIRRYLKPTNDSYRVDEAYIRPVTKIWAEFVVTTRTVRGHCGYLSKHDVLCGHIVFPSGTRG